MGIFSAFLFSFFIGIVASQEFSIDDTIQLVPVTIFVTAEEYRACKEEGHCTFTPQSVSLNESEDLTGKMEAKSYFEICRKIHFKMEKLESEHPEIKHLKLKLVQMFDKFSSELDFETEKGELVILKLLDIVKKLIEKLKKEFQEKEKVHKPDPVFTVEPVTEEVTAEPESGHPIFVGSLRGIPGIHFPNYTEIPITSFTCSDKKHIPGFYADLETGCQVFHLCYEHRRESFLCPIGTIFNQPILACDYWYSANCSLSPIYYEKPNIPEPDYIPEVIEGKKIDKHLKKDESKDIMKDFLKFLPVKAKVDIPEFGKPVKTRKLKPETLKDTEAIAEKIFDGILSLGGHLISKTSDALRKIPDPQVEIPMKMKPESFPIKNKLAVPIGKVKVASAAKLGAAAKLASVSAFASGKAKMASLAAVPLIKSKVATGTMLGAATKMASAAALASGKAKMASLAAGTVIKSKVATAAKLGAATKMASAAALASGKAKMASLAAVPVIKSKVASAALLPMIKTKVAMGTVPIVKAKAASVKVPLVKGKLFVLPLAKTKFGAAAAFPAFKVKKAVPYIKMAALKPKFIVAPLKMKSAMALPLMKTKLVKAAAISPLTKKALALGYLKLLKAKKFALMG